MSNGGSFETLVNPRQRQQHAWQVETPGVFQDTGPVPSMTSSELATMLEALALRVRAAARISRPINVRVHVKRVRFVQYGS